MLGGMSDHFKVPVRDMDANRKLGEPVTQGFSTDIFTESALSYLDEYAKGSKAKPFFCYVAYTAPHDPRSPREDTLENILKRTFRCRGITSRCTRSIMVKRR